MKTFIRPKIEINDPSYEWTGEIKRVRHGEAYCGIDGIVRMWNNTNYNSQNKYFIFRKQFVVPDFVPPGWWIAIDEDGEVNIYKERPTFKQGFWDAVQEIIKIKKDFIAAHGVTMPDVRGEKAIWQREVSNG